MKHLLIILCLFLGSEVLLATAAANQPNDTTAKPQRPALKKTPERRDRRAGHIKFNETVREDWFDALDPKRAEQFDSQIILADGTPLARWQTRAEASAVPHEDGMGDGYIPSHGIRLKSFAAQKKQEEAHTKFNRARKRAEEYSSLSFNDPVEKIFKDAALNDAAHKVFLATYYELRKDYFIIGGISQSNLTKLHSDIAAFLKQRGYDQSIIQKIDASIKETSREPESILKSSDTAQQTPSPKTVKTYSDSELRDLLKSQKSTSLSSNLQIAGITLASASFIYILYCAKKWYWNMTPENKKIYNDRFFNFILRRTNSIENE